MSQHLPSPVSYRKDINGLRAYAVIAVLLFHFSLIGLPGGFVGVDVFFVISGYLMTAIVVGGHEQGNFSLFKFYMARARRILPALMVVIASLLALGWFLLPTPDYQVLGSQSAFGLSFLSNIYYWRSAGYFDAAAHEKWLLHTWSLAVEAQFYVLYPLFIALIWRFWANLKVVTLSVLVVLVLSLLINLVVTHYEPTTAFYLLPTRVWELAAGGLVFLLAKQGKLSVQIKAYGYWLGWLLILVSFVLINDTLAWPSYWAIFPVLGASLIILGQRENCKLTDNALAQWLGDRSYSLYLWHWPLVVALYFAGLQNDWFWISGAIVSSLVLAHLSYHIVEIPTRFYLSVSSLRKEIFAIVFTGLAIGLVAVSVRLFTFENRLSAEVELASKESLNINPQKRECFDVASTGEVPACSFGSGEVTAVLAGDSHALSVATAVGKAAENYQSAAVFYGQSGCPVMFGGFGLKNQRHTGECATFNKYLASNVFNLNQLSLILVSRTSAHLHGLNEKSNNRERGGTGFFVNGDPVNYENQFLENYFKTACELNKNNTVYLLRPIPEMSVHVPNKLSRNIMFGHGNDDIKITLEEYYKRHKLVWEVQDQTAEQCGVKILNPLPYLCDDKYCYGSRNGRPLYYDDDHLSEYGNKFLVPMFEEVFKSE